MHVPIRQLHVALLVYTARLLVPSLLYFSRSELYSSSNSDSVDGVELLSGAATNPFSTSSSDKS